GPAAESIPDRAEAIRRAVLAAAPDDVVVVAGKGHEPYQEINGVRHPFSDVEQTRAALEAWNEAQGDLS
ncbi:MAG: UDP-N-acetylmuramoyl-L-alanyl-D-glutamate--2,6-diaminopimelate ligase, partial [Zoogloea sp.]|nr:UDP-N-acetylmuramoyl-L-alanyl-D-glutamate--2,6-diaminopimelate ligase [Zoogloea sp.]